MPTSPEIAAEPIPEEFTASRMRRSVAIVVAIVAVVIALVVLLPGLASLRERFEGGDPAWLVLAVVLQVLSCASYVIAFRTVFCRQMSWRTSTEIGLAELAANSVLSVGGAGGLALGAWILRRGGVSGGHIARRTVAFFLLTSLVNVSCLALGGLGLLTGVLPSDASLVLCLVPLVAGVAAIALALAAGPLDGCARPPLAAGRRLKTALSTLSEGVGEALMLLRTRQPELLIGTAGYMLLDVAVLAACFAAFGTELPTFGVLLVAYILGQLGGLIPIPGGIGGYGRRPDRRPRPLRRRRRGRGGRRDRLPRGAAGGAGPAGLPRPRDPSAPAPRGAPRHRRLRARRSGRGHRPRPGAQAGARLRATPASTARRRARRPRR